MDMGRMAMTRRVVTGNNKHGKSYVVHDGITPGHLDLAVATIDEIWIDDPQNPDPTASRDPASAAKFQIEPPLGGSVLRVMTFLPANDLPTDPAEFGSAVTNDAARFDTGDTMEKDNPGMHTTRTIDYGIVLSGEICLKLDEGEIRLTTGDVVVQRGTRHAWQNRSSEPCTVAFVLIGSANYR
jgi:hypothetical protein